MSTPKRTRTGLIVRFYSETVTFSSTWIGIVNKINAVKFVSIHFLYLLSNKTFTYVHSFNIPLYPSSYILFLLQLDLDFLPDDFFREDIHFDGQRHIVFSSSHQLSLLAKAKIWYIDGTFKVVRDPFQQLLGIHSFVRSDSDTKQLPLIFILMSRKRKKDYKKVNTCDTLS